jgi:hypothetical protein
MAGKQENTDSQRSRHANTLRFGDKRSNANDRYQSSTGQSQEQIARDEDAVSSDPGEREQRERRYQPQPKYQNEITPRRINGGLLHRPAEAPQEDRPLHKHRESRLFSAWTTIRRMLGVER